MNYGLYDYLMEKRYTNRFRKYASEDKGAMSRNMDPDTGETRDGVEGGYDDKPSHITTQDPTEVANMYRVMGFNVPTITSILEDRNRKLPKYEHSEPSAWDKAYSRSREWIKNNAALLTDAGAGIAGAGLGAYLDKKNRLRGALIGGPTAWLASAAARQLLREYSGGSQA